jgi:hypothetical protein
MDRGGVLNFGDCFSCALTKSLSAPLLFKGNDVAATDIAAAVQRSAARPKISRVASAPTLTVS